MRNAEAMYWIESGRAMMIKRIHCMPLFFLIIICRCPTSLLLIRTPTFYPALNEGMIVFASIFN